VYADSPVAADGNSEDSTGKEGIPGCSIIGTYTSDKHT